MNLEIRHPATAGTAESSDIQITIDHGSNGIEIDLNSSVEKQFGNQIRRVIKKTLETVGVTSAKLVVIDKGALDCTIEARTIAAVHRASDVTTDYNWEEIDSWNA